MHAKRIPATSPALAAILSAVVVIMPVRAELPIPLAGFPDSADSTDTADTTDTAVTTAVTDYADSTLVEFAAPADSPADSLAAAAGDSLIADAAPAISGSMRTLRPGRPLITAAQLRDLRPETLEDVVEWVPGATVRVAGDIGMPAHLSLSPIAATAPELWMDGIPTRSPGDLDPGLWDRSAIAVDRVGDFGFGAHGAPGDPGVWMQSHDPELGRVVARSRFSSTAYESFQRAVSATTPASGRTLRVDFEEWKTEEGTAYSGAPGVLSRSDAGRSKMRRFRIGTDFTTEAGRLRMFFGRGRRFYRGSVLSALDRERWTGELSLALDRPVGRAELQARAWHLDFRDDDRIHSQQTDASRTGVSLEHLAPQGGWSASSSAERWAARFAPDDTTVIGPLTAVVLRARAGWSGDPAASLVPWGFVQGVHADHLEARQAIGGRAGTDLRRGRVELRVIAERALRVPTLAETGGSYSFHTIEPLDTTFSYAGRTWQWRGSPMLEVEKQDRAGLHATIGGDRWQIGAGIDHWRLEDGVGWQPDATAEGDVAAVRGDVALDVNTASGSVRFARGLGAWTVRGSAHGQRVLGSLEPRSGRGGGWPDWSLRARLVSERRFFSIHNRLGVELDTVGLGARADDAVAAFSALRLPARWRIDGRIRLSIRDAVLSVGYDNLLDTELDEVLGTVRRGRQLRWQLDWSFYN